MYIKFFKRFFDIVLAFLAIIVLLPILLIVAILVKIKLGSPVIFKQQRPGKDEKIFAMYKFRTMTDEKDENGDLLPDSVRLTKFGRAIRSLSIDELPELFNIIKGDMSIVGPRPLALQYLPFYSENERKRHSVRPGLSGYAQINGRNSVGWEDKFAYDISYIENICFKLDFIIILKTLKKVFERSNIGERGLDSPLDFDLYRKNQIRDESVIK